MEKFLSSFVFSVDFFCAFYNIFNYKTASVTNTRFDEFIGNKF